MTTCELLSDRMPAVAAGEDAWTVAEQVHLDGCADCRAEWGLVAAIQPPRHDAATRLDPEAMARVVLARVHAAEHADRRRAAVRRALAWGGLAAAAVLLLTVLSGGADRRLPVHATFPAPIAPASVAFHLPLPELDDVAPETLQDVLDGLEAPLGESATLDDDFSADDVTQQDMERVLRAWEG